MSKDQRYIDGVLVTWGEVLFGRSVRPKKGAAPVALATATSRKSSAKPVDSAEGAAAIRKKLAKLEARKPEVMVKITGSGKNIRQIKNHLDYVSRNGELELEDQDGELIHGKEAVRDLRDDWRNGGYVIADKEGRVRESFNIVLSMPPGTDRLAVTRAARDFAKQLFGGRNDFVFATHDDDNHPHVHLVVRARGYDGKRLNPRKGDLQKWREVFAEKLEGYGIEAAATKRLTRSVVRSSVRKTPHEAQKRGADLPLHKDRPDKATGAGSATGFATEGGVQHALKRIAVELASSRSERDRELGLATRQHVHQLSTLEHVPTESLPLQAPMRKRMVPVEPEPGLER